MNEYYIVLTKLELNELVSISLRASSFIFLASSINILFPKASCSEKYKKSQINPKINMCNWQCRIPFNLRIFEIFFVIFIHCKLNKHLQCKVWKIIKTLSRFPPIAMKHYCRNRISKLRRHQEFPGFARLKNCNERRRSVGKISKEEKIRKKDAVLFRLDRQILEVKNSKRGVKLASLLRFMSLSTVLYFSYFVPEEPHKGI